MTSTTASQPSRTPRGEVLAVVLTHDGRPGLERCLGAIARQTAPAARVLVVDNASSVPVDDLVEAVRGEVLRLAENAGPAGGYAAALRAFEASTYGFAWVMDDDCEPRADSLAALLSRAAPDRVLLSSMIDRDTGEVSNTQGWCGVLLPRAVVAKVGVPAAELFWWTEDTEYLQWRIPRAGFDVERCNDAVIAVSRTRGSDEKPAWKYYYEARNQVYYRLWTQRPGDERPRPRHLRFRVRVWRAARSVAKLAVRAVWRERARRPAKVTLIARGTWDGIWRRLGRTVAADDPHRPVIQQGERP